MTTEKVAVSLPSELLSAAREAVKAGRAPSVSAYVAEAMAEKQGRERLDAVLAAMAAEDGEPTDEDRAWVRQVLDR